MLNINNFIKRSFQLFTLSLSIQSHCSKALERSWLKGSKIFFFGLFVFREPNNLKKRANFFFPLEQDDVYDHPAGRWLRLYRHTRLHGDLQGYVLCIVYSPINKETWLHNLEY